MQRKAGPPAAINCTNPDNANVKGCQDTFFNTPDGALVSSDAKPSTREKCAANEIANGLSHIDVDAIGLLPAGGPFAKAVGNLARYRGIVAAQRGTKTIKELKTVIGIGSTAYGSTTDTSPEGKLSIGLGVIGLIPGPVGQLASGVSVVVDAAKTVVGIVKCR